MPTPALINGYGRGGNFEPGDPAHIDSTLKRCPEAFCFLTNDLGREWIKPQHSGCVGAASGEVCWGFFQGETTDTRTFFLIFLLQFSRNLVGAHRNVEMLSERVLATPDPLTYVAVKNGF